MFEDMGKTLILIGIVLVVLGLIMHFGRGLLDLGHLPGDFKWTSESGHTTFYFPLASCIVVSVVLSLLMRFFSK
ncbi:MAG: DUF2905 domain-containing protein [Acidaminococcaceae bacterium]|jgi:hypothetical protein|nr:DUF2905 domain-containing protein [Acidaminococcaceae bacterium]